MDRVMGERDALWVKWFMRDVNCELYSVERGDGGDWVVIWHFFVCAWILVVPVATSVSADETEALKAEITKAVEKVQEAGEEKKTNPTDVILCRNQLVNFYIIPADPNTQILYACDSCGEKFLDASSLAQHVRIHTAQALVMFQADSDFYQQYAGDGTWQTAEQVIQGGELLFRTRVEEGEEGEATIVQSDQTVGEDVETNTQVKTEEVSEKVDSENQEHWEVTELYTLDGSKESTWSLYGHKND